MSTPLTMNERTIELMLLITSGSKRTKSEAYSDHPDSRNEDNPPSRSHDRQPSSPPFRMRLNRVRHTSSFAMVLHLFDHSGELYTLPVKAYPQLVTLLVCLKRASAAGMGLGLIGWWLSYS